MCYYGSCDGDAFEVETSTSETAQQTTDWDTRGTLQVRCVFLTRAYYMCARQQAQK